jgi:small subunit ribosomal protein S6
MTTTKPTPKPTKSARAAKKTDATTKATKVRPYEAVVIMHPDTGLEVQKELFKKNKKIIEEHNGNVHSVDTWGKRLLGNPINKVSRGIYFHSTFMADTKSIAELERTMRINDRVMRFVHTRLEDGTDLSKFLENFKNELAAGQVREREREQKAQERKHRRQTEHQEEESQE